MRRTILFAWLSLGLGGLSGLTGCAADYRQLPERSLSGLPLEGRRWLFDAENTVVAALDAVDVAREAREEARGRQGHARRAVELAQQQAGRRGTELGVSAAQQRLALCDVQLQLAEARLRLARARVRKARLDLELDKARLIVRYDLVAERGFSLQPFEAQAASAQGAADATLREVEALAQKVLAQEDRARAARQQYIAKTGDHDSGVWLD